MSFKKVHRQETITYLALWGLLFIAPVLSLSIRTANSDITFDWSEVLTVWKEYALFFVVFLIHNHLLAPMLVYQQKKLQYIGLCLTIIVIFQVYQCNHRPQFRGPQFRQELSVNGRSSESRQARLDGRVVTDEDEVKGQNSESRPPLPPDFQDGKGMPPRGNMEPGPGGPGGPDGPGGPRFKGKGPKGEERPPLIVGQHDVVTIVILILMIGMNLGIKLYFKQRGDQKKMAELEKQNLEQQLEYLKYQINPHFFMNTLNNIHALVDIDPEKAKQTILELSKMMRFVLYEGNKQGVPLDREIAFLHNYITLMKLRYTDKVRINVDTPSSLPNREIPPLMFITFVENAFKHGVSYRQESFIDIALTTDDDTLTFTCRNSRIPKEDDDHGGVGLANVKQRLDLIYGNSYTLDIKDESDSYNIQLTIPYL